MSVEHNVLIVGSGGREHALAWKIAQSPKIETVYIAPGNGGTGEAGQNIDIGAEETDRLRAFASDNQIAFTVVGPEVPLSRGIVDAFDEDRLPIFGPTQEAARLETDKAWATGFMERHTIPHPRSVIFREYDKAKEYLISVNPLAIVIKASGLAQGKGVILPSSKDEALTALENILVKKQFGDAGRDVVIQERLAGPEVSILAISDGKTVTPLLPAQDHKRIFDGDKGSNTGGMGAYAPVPFVTPELMRKICGTILQPTVDGMREEDHPFKGVLYAGLMLTAEGPKVLEYNVRFGDPETQPLMMLLSSNLKKLLHASINGSLDTQHIVFKKGAAVCVVLAADGYPDHYKTGTVIEGLDQVHDPNLVIFHAGTCKKDGQITTNGGRVLGVTARGITIEQALRSAYGLIGPEDVHFEGMQYRTDIGKRKDGVVKEI